MFCSLKAWLHRSSPTRQPHRNAKETFTGHSNGSCPRPWWNKNRNASIHHPPVRVASWWIWIMSSQCLEIPWPWCLQIGAQRFLTLAHLHESGARISLLRWGTFPLRFSTRSVRYSFIIPFPFNPPEPSTLTANFDFFILVGWFPGAFTRRAKDHLVFLRIKAFM